MCLDSGNESDDNLHPSVKIYQEDNRGNYMIHRALWRGLRENEEKYYGEKDFRDLKSIIRYMFERTPFYTCSKSDASYVMGDFLNTKATYEEIRHHMLLETPSTTQTKFEAFLKKFADNEYISIMSTEAKKDLKTLGKNVLRKLEWIDHFGPLQPTVLEMFALKQNALLFKNESVEKSTQSLLRAMDIIFRHAGQSPFKKLFATQQEAYDVIVTTYPNLRLQANKFIAKHLKNIHEMDEECNPKLQPSLINQ
jgi:hypothetical protein